MKPLLARLMLLGALTGTVTAQTPKYRVTVTVDKSADFSTIHTYAWTTGWSSHAPDVDRHIHAAIDRELQAVGLARVDAGESDVQVTYASLSRVDVDLHSKMDPVTKMRREYPVGSLVVMLLEPQTRRELFKARADKPLDTGTIESIVDGIVAEMFAKYPGRPKPTTR
jgi:Domain of unknown function (DUF4136)